MLPRRYIEEWKEFAPWPEDAQVEQDLVIEKAMLELFSDPFLQERFILENRKIQTKNQALSLLSISA